MARAIDTQGPFGAPAIAAGDEMGLTRRQMFGEPLQGLLSSLDGVVQILRARVVVGAVGVRDAEVAGARSGRRDDALVASA